MDGLEVDDRNGLRANSGIPRLACCEIHNMCVLFGGKNGCIHTVPHAPARASELLEWRSEWDISRGISSGEPRWDGDLRCGASPWSTLRLFYRLEQPCLWKIIDNSSLLSCGSDCAFAIATSHPS